MLGAAPTLKVPARAVQVHISTPLS
jgi:hypothetical protein